MADNKITLQSAPDSFASQFEQTPGLELWKKWLILLLGACLIIFLGYLIKQKTGDTLYLNIGVYGVIIALGIITIYISYRDAHFIDIQTKVASEQVKLLTELNDVAEFLNKAEQSVFKMHIASLYQIFLNSSDINQDNLIEILHSRLLARNRIVELFSSILITLGLIGTIVGLILMTNDLSAVIKNLGGSDTKLIMQQLAGNGGPLSSLGVAFYTTLLGAVFGGVILRILSNVVESNIMKYTAHIAELTEVNVLPFMRRMARNLETAGYYKNLDLGG